MRSDDNARGNAAVAEIQPVADCSQGDEKARLFDLLGLVENVCKVSEPVTSVVDHREVVGWEHELRALPGVLLNQERDGEPVWLELQRLAAVGEIS